MRDDRSGTERQGQAQIDGRMSGSERQQRETRSRLQKEMTEGQG